LPTGAHTDTYSFGVIAYEVLTGHLPEFGDRLSDFKTNVPEFLDSMISNCISARVDRRPVDGKMLVDMLAVHHESRDKSSLITRNSAQGQRKSTSNVIHSHLTKYPHLAAYMRSLQSIPAGEYVMGSDAGYADERPQHTVKVSRFRLGKTPVTNALWREYVSGLSQEHTNPQMAGQLDDHPVVNVSWEDVMGQDGNGGFCRWISENAGFRLTLPTEARFEYASRSGNSDSEYPWGNYYEDVFAWTSVVTKRTTTGPVSRRNCIYTNDFGLTDMVGNVWQLCFDRYGSYPSDSTTDPTGPACINGKNRCKRGGSWLHNYSGYVRSSLRHQIPPNHRCGQTGFRLAAEAG
jgi:formylglycine-generating enzyme required for sulfatase activity